MLKEFVPDPTVGPRPQWLVLVDLILPRLLSNHELLHCVHSIEPITNLKSESECFNRSVVTVACQVPLSMEFSRQEYWSELLFPTPMDLPDPWVEPGSLALEADSLLSELPGKP